MQLTADQQNQVTDLFAVFNTLRAQRQVLQDAVEAIPADAPTATHICAVDAVAHFDHTELHDALETNHEFILCLAADLLTDLEDRIANAIAPFVPEDTRMEFVRRSFEVVKCRRGDVAEMQGLSGALASAHRRLCHALATLNLALA